MLPSYLMFSIRHAHQPLALYFFNRIVAGPALLLSNTGEGFLPRQFKQSVYLMYLFYDVKTERKDLSIIRGSTVSVRSALVRPQHIYSFTSSRTTSVLLRMEFEA